MNPVRAGLLITALTLCGCGQKGALYLPETTRTEVPAAQAGAIAPSTAPAASTEAEKKQSDDSE